MIVKCPKCRFRFDVTVSPGMRELQCNCPRCGVPFIHTITDEEAASVSRDNANSTTTRLSGAVPPRIPGSHPGTASTTTGTSAQGGSHQGYTSTSDGQNPPEPPKRGKVVSGYAIPPIPPSKALRSQSQPSSMGTPPVRKNRRYRLSRLRPFLIGGIVLLLLAGAISHCVNVGEYDSEVNEGTSVSTSDSTGSNIPIYNEKMGEQKVPEWVQGKWYYQTEYGGITVFIHGNKLSESSGGETLTGRFRYQNHVLYGNFGKGGKFNYRVLEDTHQIDCGNGMMMKKIP
jgi:hypothetical protein